MKNLIYIFCLLTYCSVQAQKKLEKTFPISANTQIFLNLKYASSIEVKYWDKQEISMQVSVNLNENKDNDNFELIEQKTDNQLEIQSNIQNIKGIAKLQDNNSDKQEKHYYNGYSNNSGYWDSENQVYIRKGKEISADIIYQIFVPKNNPLKVKTISGNLIVDYFPQKIKLENISGNIELNFRENQKANFKIQSITGDVYTNLEGLEFPSKKDGALDRVGGGFKTELEAKYKGGGEEIILKTISGDILIKKK